MVFQPTLGVDFAICRQDIMQNSPAVEGRAPFEERINDFHLRYFNFPQNKEGAPPGEWTRLDLFAMMKLYAERSAELDDLESELEYCTATAKPAPQ